MLQVAVSASKRLEEELAALEKSYSEACAEIERLKAILHQAASAIRASLEVCDQESIGCPTGVVNGPSLSTHPDCPCVVASLPCSRQTQRPCCCPSGRA